MREKITINDMVKNLKMQVVCGEECTDRIISRHMTSRPGVEIYSD